MGGDYITEFLYVLLERIGFPYRDIDLARSYDWNVMEDLKSRLCTLTEVRRDILSAFSWQELLTWQARRTSHSIFTISLSGALEDQLRSTAYVLTMKSFSHLW